MPAALLLDYAGPDPASRRPLAVTCWRAAVNLVTATILAAVLVVRFALLFAGFTCVGVGTLLLTLGGRRGAARKVARWRESAADHVSLWSRDIGRGVGRWWHEVRPEQKRREQRSGPAR